MLWQGCGEHNLVYICTETIPSWQMRGCVFVNCGASLNDTTRSLTWHGYTKFSHVCWLACSFTCHYFHGKLEYSGVCLNIYTGAHVYLIFNAVQRHMHLDPSPLYCHYQWTPCTLYLCVHCTLYVHMYVSPVVSTSYDLFYTWKQPLWEWCWWCWNGSSG